MSACPLRTGDCGFRSGTTSDDLRKLRKDVLPELRAPTIRILQRR